MIEQRNIGLDVNNFVDGLKNMLDDCCRLEFDHRGRLCAYERKNGGCNIC